MRALTKQNPFQSNGKPTITNLLSKKGFGQLRGIDWAGWVPWLPACAVSAGDAEIKRERPPEVVQHRAAPLHRCIAHPAQMGQNQSGLYF